MYPVGACLTYLPSRHVRTHLLRLISIRFNGFFVRFSSNLAPVSVSDTSISHPYCFAPSTAYLRADLMKTATTRMACARFYCRHREEITGFDRFLRLWYQYVHVFIYLIIVYGFFYPWSAPLPRLISPHTTNETECFVH